MARVPSVTNNIANDVPPPHERRPDVDAGVLEVDADVPDDFDWEAVDDDNDQVTCSDEEQSERDKRAKSNLSSDQSNGNKPKENGRQESLPAAGPTSSVFPTNPPRHPGGVVADPMGVNGVEDGEIERKQPKKSRKKKEPTQSHHCELCNVRLSSVKVLEDHLKGRKHKIKESQALLKDKNKEISSHHKANLDRSSPADKRRRPDDAGESTRPPQESSPLANPSTERGNPSGRTGIRPQRRDPYAPPEKEHRKEQPHEDAPDLKRRKHRGDTEQSAHAGHKDPSKADHEDRRTILPNSSGRNYDSRERNPYPSRETIQQPEVRTRPNPSPPSLKSVPVSNERHEDRRSSDPTRGFTYGSVRPDIPNDGSTLVPHEWLSLPFDLKHWRDLYSHVFTYGDDVDQLAFKILQEILVAPITGVGISSLAPFSRGMLEAVRNQRISSENEVYARLGDFPEELLTGEFSKARVDPGGQKTPTPEQLALRLVGDNVLYSLKSFDDRDTMTADPDTFPKRGLFGQQTLPQRIDGDLPEDPDVSVAGDKLLGELNGHVVPYNWALHDLTHSRRVVER